LTRCKKKSSCRFGAGIIITDARKSIGISTQVETIGTVTELPGFRRIIFVYIIALKIASDRVGFWYPIAIAEP
jgi:hypothetical protein